MIPLIEILSANRLRVVRSVKNLFGTGVPFEV